MDDAVTTGDNVVDILECPVIRPLLIPHLGSQLQAHWILEVGDQCIQVLLHSQELPPHALVGVVIILNQKTADIEPGQQQIAHRHAGAVGGLGVAVGECALHDGSKVFLHLRTDNIERVVHQCIALRLLRGYLSELGEILVKFPVEVIDGQQETGIRRQLPCLCDHADRRPGPLLDTLNIVPACIDDEVLGKNPCHQHVGLNATVGIGLTRERAIVLEVPIGCSKAEETHRRDDDQEREYHAESGQHFCGYAGCPE